MPAITDTELSAKLKANDIDSLYFFYGKEFFLLKRAVDAIVKKTVSDDMKTFNFQKFDAEKTPADDIADAVYALPMMSDKKCVLVNNLNVSKISPNEHEKIKQIIADVPDTTVLIFAIPAIEIQMKKEAKWKSFSTIISKHGTSCEFVQKDRGQLSKLLVSRAKKRGSTLTSANALALVDRVGNNLGILYNELDKLCDYLQDGEILLTHIEQCTTPSIEATSFDFAKAVVRKDFDRAFLILDELLYQKIKPIAILGAINSSFIDLYRAYHGRVSRKTNPEIVTDFGYPKNVAFRVQNASRDSSRLTAPQLRHYIKVLYETDILLKTTSIDGQIALEQLMGKLRLPVH